MMLPPTAEELELRDAVLVLYQQHVRVAVEGNFDSWLRSEPSQVGTNLNPNLDLAGPFYTRSTAEYL